MSLTLGEALALAVLKGDKVAAYALADSLLEERARGGTPLDEGYLESGRPGPTGYEVYHWPEFRAFAKRLGILWSVYTNEISLRLNVDEPVEINQSYRGVDRSSE
jgi:hypothetical protein